MHLIARLVLGIGCLWVVAYLVEAGATRDPLAETDRRLLNTLYGRATPLTTNMFMGVSLFGSQVVVVLGLSLVALFIRWRQWLDLARGVLAVAGGELLNHLLKLVFERPRPVFEDPLVTVNTYSFPSGHAMIALLFYGLLAYMYLRRLDQRRTRVLLLVDTALVIALIGFSRVALAVHYLGDVVGSYAAGGVWLITSIAVTEVIHQRHIRS
jgi:undecaprenyl-diphosphatase